MDLVPTTCVYCGCGCGINLHVEDGRVVATSPVMDHPMSRGRLCVKGWLAHGFIHHPDRLLYPQQREGDRFVRISWDEALSLMVSRFHEIRERYGPDSLGFLTSAKASNEDNYLLMKLARAGFCTNNVDHVARLCHAPTLSALGVSLGSGSMTNPISSLAQAETVLVIGSNTTEQHPLVASYILEAKRNGATLIVADPRRTQLAREAGVHLTPRPGSDVAWLNGLLNIILQESLVDQEFVDSRTEGFDQVKESVSRYTPEVVERLSHISPRDLRRTALAFGQAQRASVVYAMGITQHICGTNNVQAIANLALATGNLGREGTGIYPLRGHQNVQGACDMGALPAFYSGYQKVDGFREKFSQAWGVKLPEAPGLKALEMIQAAEGGTLKAMFISGENPVLSYPHQASVIKALSSLEFLVVADIFPTATTRLGHLMLPLACFAEREGSFTSTERRVQRVRRAVAPPGEALSEWTIAARLLDIMGVPSPYQDAAQVMEEIARLTPSYGGIALERLGVEGLQWPCPSQEHPGTPILHASSFSQGRARFLPVEHTSPSELPDAEYPFLLTTGRSLYHFHTATMTRRIALLDRERPFPEVDINPSDAKMTGIRHGSPVMVESRRGQVQATARLTDDVPEGTVFMDFHFQEGPANALTGGSVDPLSGIPDLKVTAVRIREAKH